MKAAIVATAAAIGKTACNQAAKRDQAGDGESRVIRIRAEDGRVSLQGTVASQAAKDSIAGIARRIAGSARVEDDLKVAERVGAGEGDR